MSRKSILIKTLDLSCIEVNAINNIKYDESGRTIADKNDIIRFKNILDTIKKGDMLIWVVKNRIDSQNLC